MKSLKISEINPHYKTKFFGFLAAGCVIALAGCSEVGERQETVSKLRTLGVIVTPFVTGLSPATAPITANLTFLAVLPTGQKVTSEVFTDAEAKYSYPVKITELDNSKTYMQKAKFSIFQTQASMIIPSDDIIREFPSTGFVPIRYGMKLNSDAGEEEKVVGNIVVFDEGEEALTWIDTPPSVSITNVTEGDTIPRDSELTAEIINKNGEKFRIGWFVSSGKVKHRNAAHSAWSEIESGPQTVIVTARGRSTASFSWQAIDVTVK